MFTAIARMVPRIAAQVAPAPAAASEEEVVVLVVVFRAAPGSVSPAERAAGPLPIRSIATLSGRLHRAREASAGSSSVSICAPARPAALKYGPIKLMDRRPPISSIVLCGRRLLLSLRTITTEFTSEASTCTSLPTAETAGKSLARI